jgi:two-component system, OmpR family, response regulator
LERTPHILIADDDQQIRLGLARFLIGQGMRVTQAGNGSELSRAMESSHIDLVVLDIMMPGEDGLSICRRLRSQSQIPIVLLTAVAGETDRIVGLELGADDYICKPFVPRELLARLRTIMRRVNGLSSYSQAARVQQFLFNGWRFDLQNRVLYSASGATVDLTTGEFDLLQAFVEHPQVVLTRDQLLDLAKGRSIAPFDRSIDVQVMRLRRKIEIDPQLPQMIKTVRNRGYIFTPSISSSPGVQ